MPSLLEIIRTKLINAGVGNSTTWPVFIGYAPDDQDTIIGLMPTGGYAADTLLNENVIESFQLKVRAGKLDFATAEAKWRETFNALQDADLSASGIGYIQALATGPMMWLDDNHRQCASSNWKVMRRRP